VDLGPFIAIGVMTVLITAGQLLLPSRAKRRARRIERALAARPRTWIAAARGGPVRVSGRIRRDGALLEAPLSGRPCVACALVADVLQNAGGTGLWRRLVDLQQAQPFLLTDETGTARVDTSAPFFLALIPDRIGKTSGPYPGKHRAISLFLESNGIKAINWLGRWRPIYYAEGVLEQDEIVSVGGDSTLEIDPGGETPSPRSPPLRLVLRGTDAQPLLIGRASRTR